MTPAQFKTIRAELKLTQASLAERLGVSIRQVKRLESGVSEISGPIGKLMDIFSRPPGHRRIEP